MKKDMKKEIKKTKKTGGIKATKLYDFVDVKDKDRGVLVFVSEYYLEGKGMRFDEIKVNQYVVNVPPDDIIYHTVIQKGHNVKNITKYVHEDNSTKIEDGGF